MSNNELADELVDGLDLDLLAQLWSEPEAQSDTTTIVATDHSSGTLSFQQKRLWLLQQIDPISNAYDVLRAYRAPDALDLLQLQCALDALVECHDIFRTYYQFDGAATQVVASQCQVPLTLIEVDTELDGDALFAQQEVKAWCDKPFNLSQVPLLKAAWVRTVQGGYLLLRNHHIVSDAWSKTLILKDLLAAYQGQALTKPSCRYLDYATWQSEYLLNEEANNILDYWQGYVGAAPQPIALPMVEPETEHPVHALTLSFQLPSAQVQQVNAFCQRHGNTAAALFMTLLQATLSRFSSTAHFLIGSPTAARNLPELADVVGCFMNTQLYRNEVQDGVTFLDAIECNQRHTLRLINEDQVPFEWLAEQLEWPVQADRHPHFQVLFNYLQSDPQPSSDQTMALIPVSVESHTAKFELSLDVSVQEGAIELYFEADSTVYSQSLLQQLQHSYLTLLHAVLHEPQQSINNVLIHQPDSVFCAPQQDNDAVTIIDLITKQGSRQESLAIADDSGAQLSYQKLLELSANFAHFLIAQGVQSEDRIVIITSRQVDMVIALLGCMQAGAVYVPIDPTMPQQRQQLIFNSSAAVAIVTNIDTVYNPGNLPVWSIAAVNEQQSPQPPFIVRIRPQQLAYILYTSGSTGQPKGVAISHGNLVNFILAMQSQFSLTHDSKWLALTALGFDISGLELYLPLVSGAQTYIANSVLELQATDLIGITHIQATPAGWQALLAKELISAAVIGLCGGEALPPALAQSLQDKQVTLYNMYGPTETTVWSSSHLVTAHIHLGHPIRNTQLYVLDQHLNACPQGVCGELYIGGLGLARGYFAQPALTAQRFIANPFSDMGERLYRTGDLVEVNARNELHFLGRTDHQIKIRGHRIEIGEIESQLLCIDGITQAVVVAHDAEGSKQLIGYVCTQQLQSEDIKTALSALVPSYMVPEQLIILDTLPLNHSGKVDRKALPAPSLQQTQGTLPVGHVEQALARVWQQILQRQQVFREDNFFALGGNSIHALRMVHQWHKLARPEPLVAQAIWQADNLRALAEQMVASKQASVSDILPESVGGRAPSDLLICLHDGRGFTMSYRPLAMAMPEQVRCVGITPDTELSSSDNFKTLASRYAQQLGDLSGYENIHVLGWSLGGALALQLVEALALHKYQVANVFLIDSWDPFEPANQRSESWRDYILTRLSESVAAPERFTDFAQAVRAFPWSDGDSSASRGEDISRFVTAHLALLEKNIAAMPVSEIIQTLEQTYLLRCAGRHEVEYHTLDTPTYYAVWSTERDEVLTNVFNQRFGIEHIEYVNANHMEIISHGSVIETVQKVIKLK
ncbi:non-ribosomal peptide synthetase [Pseudoalteromonas peptidolytica]|uniref:non-ribosomal peptide synthetase n=1 Tax=Pseudoalteromonas peptidolytica TaxID=61150 RepID=UPI00298E61D0|nr:amino acid adenylation domain-containing protein [Pseudoalteromonas peptidolytica]MDW7550790.1 amino acid adenylation domain-containing protein [Pseudoalteromonas peptidolytica]